MRSVTIIFLFLLSQAITLSQSCLPEGIVFRRQSQIDSFQINYPGCIEIEGNVTITGQNINNLNGLNTLILIGGFFGVYGIDSLYTFEGLENLTAINEGFNVWYNLQLLNTEGLNNLQFVGGQLWFDMNPNLSSLSGLGSLNIIEGGLAISFNGLISLTGLGSLNSIEGSLSIRGNDYINNLSGLENVDLSSITNLGIIENTSLSECEVESICNYLASPNGKVYIRDNFIGCNSKEEVMDSCGIVSIQVISEDDVISASPNPFTTSTTLSFRLGKPENVQFTVYNVQSKIVYTMEERQDKGVQKVTWNAEGLPAGMYFYRLQAGDRIASGKLMISGW